MSLSHRYLPNHHFSERHELVIRGRSEAIIAAVQGTDPGTDRLIGPLIRLRQRPARLLDHRQAATFGLGTFTRLEQVDDEIAFGLVGRFWRLDFGLHPIADGAAFHTFNQPGVAKLLLSFKTEPVDAALTRLITTTRVFCPDRTCYWRLAPYWMVIRPVSGFIRRRMLRLVKRAVEEKG